MKYVRNTLHWLHFVVWKIIVGEFIKILILQVLLSVVLRFFFRCFGQTKKKILMKCFQNSIINSSDAISTILFLSWCEYYGWIKIKIIHIFVYTLIIFFEVYL